MLHCKFSVDSGPTRSVVGCFSLEEYKLLQTKGVWLNYLVQQSFTHCTIEKSQFNRSKAPAGKQQTIVYTISQMVALFPNKKCQTLHLLIVQVK